MSYLKRLQEFYLLTYKARYAINAYNVRTEWENEEPTTVTVHETTLNYGGPEEGGWFYQAGYPIKTHCIFSKKQAIKTFIQYIDEYELVDQPSLGVSTTYYNYEVSYANGYATVYPETKPHYC